MIFHPDHLGSISYLTDPSGNVVTRMSYTPYGEKVKSACTGLDIFNHKYTGQVDDTSTGLSAGTSGNAVEDDGDAGLLYYNARYYDPYIGRFISADSIVPGAGNTQSFNRYMYVAGNPVNHNDPSGHKWGSGLVHKVCDAICNTINNVKDSKVYDISSEITSKATGKYAWNKGGWKGLSLFAISSVINAVLKYFEQPWVVNFSYTYEGGYGAGIGVGLNQYAYVGIDYEQESDFTVSAGIRYSGSYSQGGGIGIGYNQHGYVSIGYSVGIGHSYNSPCAADATYHQEYDANNGFAKVGKGWDYSGAINYNMSLLSHKISV